MTEDAFLQLVSFGIGDELFAVPITKIQEIIRLTNIVKVPKSPDFVEGVINLRGRVIPVVDLKKRFSIGAYVQDVRTRIIVAEMGALRVGLIVDIVCEVLSPDECSFEETPSIVSGVDQKFVRGIVKQNEKMLIVLDLDKILSRNETNILQTVH